jgi:hypothetical protein
LDEVALRSWDIHEASAMNGHGNKARLRRKGLIRKLPQCRGEILTTLMPQGFRRKESAKIPDIV